MNEDERFVESLFSDVEEPNIQNVEVEIPEAIQEEVKDSDINRMDTLS